MRVVFSTILLSSLLLCAESLTCDSSLEPCSTGLCYYSVQDGCVSRGCASENLCGSRNDTECFLNEKNEKTCCCQSEECTSQFADKPTCEQKEPDTLVLDDSAEKPESAEKRNEEASDVLSKVTQATLSENIVPTAALNMDSEKYETIAANPTPRVFPSSGGPVEDAEAVPATKPSEPVETNKAVPVPTESGLTETEQNKVTTPSQPIALSENVSSNLRDSVVPVASSVPPTSSPAKTDSTPSLPQVVDSVGAKTTERKVAQTVTTTTTEIAQTETTTRATTAAVHSDTSSESVPTTTTQLPSTVTEKVEIVTTSSPTKSTERPSVPTPVRVAAPFLAVSDETHDSEEDSTKKDDVNRETPRNPRPHLARVAPVASDSERENSTNQPIHVTTSAVESRERTTDASAPVPWWSAALLGLIVSIIVAWIVVAVLKRKKAARSSSSSPNRRSEPRGNDAPASSPLVAQTSDHEQV